MNWYLILFITVCAIFFAKLIISWFAGDIDLDVDFDGDNDFDSSSAFSFKGLIHFLLGFSGFLFGRSYMIIPDKNGTVHLSVFDYLLAIACGIVIMLILYFAYKIALKANNSSQDPQDLINNADGIIYLNLGNGQYSVEAHTLAGTQNITAFYSGDDLEPGTKVKLMKENNNILIYTLDV